MYLKFNYAMDRIIINGLWFELDENKYQKIGYKGLNLYFTLFKFRIYKQQHDYMFLTSISLLRKETGYKTDEILELLKIMKRYKILGFDNISRWDILIDDKGKIKDREMIVCYAIDIPDTKIEGTRFVNIDLNLLNHYLAIGLNEKYYPIYCLIRYQADRNPEKKSFTSIIKTAKALDMDKDTFNKMIHMMNRKYLLYSHKRKNGKGDYYFEHRICNSMEQIESFIDPKLGIKDGIDKNIRQWDKANVRKEKSRIKRKKEID